MISSLWLLLGCPAGTGSDPTTVQPTPAPSTPAVDSDGDGWREEDGDCDDQDANTYPGAWEVPYDGRDNDCDGVDLTDVDLDGFDAVEAGGPDCDDQNPAIHPDATDDCGGGDEDCDGVPDDDEDQDQDGFSACAGDCDDEDPNRHPDAYDVALNGVDENCNGVDKGNCDDAVLEESHVLWGSVDAVTCTGGSAVGFSDTILGEGTWSVPEDADCSGSMVAFDGQISYPTVDSFCPGGSGTIRLSGSFEFDTTSGCGSFDGEIIDCDGAVCTPSNGTVAYASSCI